MGHLLGGSVVALVATSSKRPYATWCMFQVHCSQSPCPRGRPLLTHASAGDTQTFKGRSGSVSAGSLGLGAHKVLFEPSESHTVIYPQCCQTYEDWEELFLCQ